MKYAWIEDHSDEFEVTAMCRVLDVTRSGYYACRKRSPSARAQRREELLAAIREVHADREMSSYGSPRMLLELCRQGYCVSENTVAKLMSSHGIRACTARKFKATTDSNHRHPVAKNLLNQEFSRAQKPNEVWLADITSIWTDEGWLYLAAVKDLCTRKIVGWSMSSRMTQELVCDALRMAIGRESPGVGLLAHSDRGSQYASGSYQALLSESGFVCSMSRKGNCYDNAPMESFFATLKKELVHLHRYRSRACARRSIFEYIEMFYNRRRLHSSLGYLSPVEFEETL